MRIYNFQWELWNIMPQYKVLLDFGYLYLRFKYNLHKGLWIFTLSDFNYKRAIYTN